MVLCAIVKLYFLMINDKKPAQVGGLEHLAFLKNLNKGGVCHFSVLGLFRQLYFNSNLIKEFPYFDCLVIISSQVKLL